MSQKKNGQKGFVPPKLPKKPANTDKGAGYVPPSLPKRPPVKKDK